MKGLQIQFKRTYHRAKLTDDKIHSKNKEKKERKRKEKQGRRKERRNEEGGGEE